MPPASETRMLSVSSCLSRRSRVAPRAVRTAISFERAAARASSRLATLAQAMRSTNPTAPRSTSSAGRTSPVAGDAEARHQQAPVFGVGVGIFALELLADRPHLALRLLDRHPRLHPGREVEELVGPVLVGQLVGGEDHRRPDLRGPVEEVAEPARHDAYDLVALAVEREVAADDGRVGPEDPLPGVVADHRHVLPAGGVLARLKCPAQQGGHLQRGEELSR